MNRGFEIIRRLLLTIVWGITLVFTFGLPITACNEKRFDPPAWLQVKNKDDYNKVVAYAKSLKENDPKLESARKELQGYHHWQNKRKGGWLLVVSGLFFPLLGFGLHRLINWILVHKPSN